MEEGQLDDTTTVAIRRFYKKIENEKPAKEEKLTLEETHDIINLNWFPYEPRES